MELYCLDWQKAEPTHTGMETSNLALCVGKAKLLYVQWNLSIVDTTGPRKCVLIRETSLSHLCAKVHC